MRKVFGPEGDHLGRSQQQRQHEHAQRVIEQEREKRAGEKSLWLPLPAPIRPHSPLTGRLRKFH
jgi:hypothetical protein